MNDAAAPCKRRKASPNEVALTDLPNDQLVAIVDYLPAAARALFAAALTAPSNSWRRARGWAGELTEASRAIISVSDPWDVLDFGELGAEWATRLTDNDVGAVLAAVDARRGLKTLRLGQCNGLVGDGLYPLRGSLVLEDMNFGRHAIFRNRQSNWLLEEHEMLSLTPEAVLPILNSIIDREGNALRAIAFPSSWSERELRMKPHMRDFSRKFTRLLSLRGLECNYCDPPDPDGDEEFSPRSCEACFTCICMDCDDYVAPHARSCDHCNVFLCGDCGDHVECFCGKVNCGLCSKREGTDIAQSCGGDYCEHQCLRCMSDPECEACSQAMVPVLLAGYRRLERENKELKERMSSADLGVLSNGGED